MLQFTALGQLTSGVPNIRGSRQIAVDTAPLTDRKCQMARTASGGSQGRKNERHSTPREADDADVSAPCAMSATIVTTGSLARRELPLRAFVRVAAASAGAESSDASVMKSNLLRLT